MVCVQLNSYLNYTMTKSYQIAIETGLGGDSSFWLQGRQLIVQRQTMSSLSDMVYELQKLSGGMPKEYTVFVHT